MPRIANINTYYLEDGKVPTFNGDANEDVHIWLWELGAKLTQRHIPREDWVLVGQRFLGEELQEMMEDARYGFEKLEPEGWNWDKYTSALILIHDQVKKDAAGNGEDPPVLAIAAGNDPESASSTTSRLALEHPVKTAAAAISLIALGGITVGPAIAGDPFAAGIQSTFYDVCVTSGSAFALAQSAVAGGVGVVAAAPIQALSAGAMALGAWIGFGRSGATDGGSTDQSKGVDPGEKDSKPTGFGRSRTTDGGGTNPPEGKHSPVLDPGEEGSKPGPERNEQNEHDQRFFAVVRKSETILPHELEIISTPATANCMIRSRKCPPLIRTLRYGTNAGGFESVLCFRQFSMNI